MKKIILILVAILLIINIMSNFIRSDKELNIFEKTIKDISLLTHLPFKKEVTIREPIYYEAELKELQKEITDLKEIIDLNSTLSEYDCINATVISSKSDTIMVDKGSIDGVKRGSAVVVSSGLIGKVINVSNFTSTIRLLTNSDSKNKISVKIVNDDYYYGLLVGYDKKSNIYKIEGIEQIDKINVGDMVTTTGLTDYFPGGLMIGKVSKIVKDEYDLTAIVEVIPSVNFNSISIVTILDRKTD